MRIHARCVTGLETRGVGIQNGSEILGAVVFSGGGDGDGAWPKLAGRLEQRAALVLEQTQAIAGHGQAAGGAVEDGPCKREAVGLARDFIASG
jgi:hypothetical protein